MNPHDGSKSRHRRAHFFDESDDLKNDANEILFMDDIQQEDLIKELKIEEHRQNELYSKLLWYITIIVISFFGTRWHNGYIWLNYDLFVIISLLISFTTVPQQTFLHKSELRVLNPGKRWLRMQKCNVFLSGLMSLWIWTKQLFIIENGCITDPEGYVSAVPFLIAFMGWYMRINMEGVDFKPLVEAQYKLMGA
jgi:hypothetical protein